MAIIFNNNKYFVSVIIPVYNGETYIAEAVESILRQNHEPLEIIIVDDGSTDNTAEIAAGLKCDVRYVHQLNSGPSAARNRGLRMARGDVIGFLDVDDLWSENKLNIQLGHLEKNPEKEIVLGLLQRMQLIRDKDGTHLFKEWDQPVMNMHLGSGLFRKSVFDKVGCLDESLDYCEDWDWFMRAKEMNVPMLVHKEVTYYYRRHDKNITNDTETNSNFALKMLRQSLSRRRKHEGGQAAKLSKLSDFTTDSGQLSEEKQDGKEKNRSDD